MKAFSSILLLNLFSFSMQAVYAQRGSITVRLLPNDIYGSLTDSLETTIYIYKDLEDTNAFSIDTILHRGQHWTIVGNIPADTYTIQTSTYVPYDQFTGMPRQIRDTTFRNVVVESYHNTDIKAVFPPQCGYWDHRNDKTCPKCHQSDMVVPIVYGLLVIDPNDPDVHLPAGSPLREDYEPGGCEVTGCDPHWHCRRDFTDF